ncbi:MAG: chlorite dismutase family protein [Nitrospirae bacterium]|nr:chlorite dismutase family protein [Nitrospirota bacterium]
MSDREEVDTAAPTEPQWTEEGRAQMQNVPFIVRKSAMRSVEEFAKSRGIGVIDPSVIVQARAAKEQGDLPTARPQEGIPTAQKPPVAHQYVSFLFYKVDPLWRRLPPSEREQGKNEFIRIVEEYTKDRKQFMALTYSTMGTRGDVDFMMWRIGYSLEYMQEFTAKLFATKLGGYLTTPYSYLAITKRSVYVDKINPEHEEQRLRIVPGKAKYLFMYPFVKTPEWYLLTKHTRQGMMDEHIIVGNKYPSVKLNTTYSFGLDDQEFSLAFETDKPEDFVNLLMDLRETQGRIYTQRDTPIFTCVNRGLKDTLDLLGG